MLRHLVSTKRVSAGLAVQLLKYTSIQQAPAIVQQTVVPSVCKQTSFSTAANSTSGGVVEIKTDADYQQKLADAKDSAALSVLDFTARWCAPCKVIAPVLEKLSQKHTDVSIEPSVARLASRKINFYKIDIDNEQVRNTVMDNSISAVPTFAFLKGDKKLASFSGADQKQLGLLIEQLRSSS